MPLKTIVLFNTLDEFLEELELERDDSAHGLLIDDRRILRQLLRVTNELHRSAMPSRSVYVLAAFVTERRNGVGSWEASELVQLREYAGQIWDSDEGTMGEINAATKERVDAVKDAVKQACERLELAIRGGSYQAVA